MLNTSATIADLAAALAQARGAYQSARASKPNHHFKTSYAGLDDIIAATATALSENGLVVVQGCAPDNTDVLITRILHKSGEWIETVTPIIAGRGGGPQAYGSGLTYAKRYGMAAALGVMIGDDDDGNAAQAAHNKSPAADPAPQRSPSAHAADTMIARIVAMTDAEAIRGGLQNEGTNARLAAMSDTDAQRVRDAAWARIVELERNEDA